MYDDDDAYNEEIGSVFALFMAVAIFFAAIFGVLCFIDSLKDVTPEGATKESYDYGLEYEDGHK